MRPTAVARSLIFESLTLLLSFWNMTSPVSKISTTPAQAGKCQHCLAGTMNALPDSACIRDNALRGHAACQFLQRMACAEIPPLIIVSSVWTDRCSLMLL